MNVLEQYGFRRLENGITLKFLEKNYYWLVTAKKKNVVVKNVWEYRTGKGGRLGEWVILLPDQVPPLGAEVRKTSRIWVAKGEWKNGLWNDSENLYYYGNWLGGGWEMGIWYGGMWDGGFWKDGIWENGIWRNGDWVNGVWNRGEWKYGIWRNGLWEDGIWKGGIWRNGVWNGGIWENGVWYDGKWKGGIWLGGYDRLGKFHPKGDSPDRWKK